MSLFDEPINTKTLVEIEATEELLTSIEQTLVQHDSHDLFEVVDVENQPEENLQADRILWVINKLEHELALIEQDAQASAEFYIMKKDKKERQINYLGDKLHTFISGQGVKTIKVPNGNIRLTTRKKDIYPDDDILMAWCIDNDIPLRIKSQPDKKMIKEYIKDTGNAPDDYTVEEQTTFSYKTTSNGR
tara:strand:+ start:800 stop:1366 length:567 start_codon:yes stop_codon:yes gene_type:complete